MAALTILTFQVEPFDPGRPSVLSVSPVLNGMPLIRLIADFESASNFDVAGSYAGLVPDHYRFGPLNCHFLADSSEFDFDGNWQLNDRYLLGCDCGEVGCWPLTATITKSGDTITWDNFRQPHRQMRDYSECGPFYFDFEAYERVVNEITEQFPER